MKRISMCKGPLGGPQVFPKASKAPGTSGREPQGRTEAFLCAGLLHTPSPTQMITMLSSPSSATPSLARGAPLRTRTQMCSLPGGAALHSGARTTPRRSSWVWHT